MLLVRTPAPQVALGKSAALTKIDTSLTAPPAGYDSVHGVRYVVTVETTQSSPEQVSGLTTHLIGGFQAHLHQGD
jgi:hypothetical protein